MQRNFCIWCLKFSIIGKIILQAWKFSLGWCQSNMHAIYTPDFKKAYDLMILAGSVQGGQLSPFLFTSMKTVIPRQLFYSPQWRNKQLEARSGSCKKNTFLIDDLLSRTLTIPLSSVVRFISFINTKKKKRKKNHFLLFSGNDFLEIIHVDRHSNSLTMLVFTFYCRIIIF